MHSVGNSARACRAETQIHVHTPETLAPMREACILARNMLDLCCEMAQPGITTDEIDSAVHAAIVEAGACPSPLNYHGFPKVVLGRHRLTFSSINSRGYMTYSYPLHALSKTLLRYSVSTPAILYIRTAPTVAKVETCYLSADALFAEAILLKTSL